MTTTTDTPTFEDILTDVLDRAGENPGDASSPYMDTAKRQIVRGYHDLCNAYPFLFLRATTPAVLRTVAPLTAGTVLVTQDSTYLAFSSPPATSVSGRKILVTGSSEWYRIAAHSAGSDSATLDAAYGGTSDPAAGYTVFQDEYELSVLTRHILAMVVAESGHLITQKSEDFLRESYATPTAGFPPLHFARITETRIRFSQYPTAARRIEVPYTVVPDDPDVTGNAIMVPRNWRYAIADAGLYWTYLAKDDDRASAAMQLYLKSREDMIVDDERKRMGLTARIAGR